MSDQNKGIIAWFVNNPVASNLLVCMILVAGFFSVTLMKRDILPVPESRKIVISAVYPTASPKEVDEAITTKIEDALKNITEIRRIETNSSIGFSMITIEVEDKADIDLVLADVKTQVDTISTFPKELEKLSITKGKPIQFAMQVQISGKIDETQAKKLAEEIKRELLTQTIIKRVDILGTRPYEVSIEVSEEQLQKYRVTLGQVATKIRAESVNSPIGIVKSAEDYTLIRVEGQAYRQQDFENIVLLTTETGAVVRVKDVAVVKDAYIDFENKASFDGEYSVGLAISAVGDQDVIEVAEAAKAYVAEKKATLPDGVYLTSWLDATYYLKSRLNTMNSNLIYGALLVFLLLILFMELKMAFWVVAGIPVSIGGAFILMNMGFSNVTLNMVSMFGFIMVVGIVIDDSIVVAESVDDEIRKTGFNQESIIRGTKRVATPAIFGILTTIVAFTPMLFVTGSQHVYMYSVGFVVCACLLFSLMESKWVLPSHLMSVNSGLMRFFYSSHQDRLQKWVNKKLNHWIHSSYLPFVEKTVEKRYITLAIFASILIVTLGAVKSGIIRYELFPAEPNDFITASYSISRDASKEEIRIAKQEIQDSLHEMEQDYQKEFATDTKLTTHLFTYGGDTGGLMLLELTKSENRLITSFEVAERWRKKAATIRNVNLNVSDSKSAGSRGLSYLLVGSDRAELEAAAESLLSELKNIEGLSSENHSIENQRLEYVLKLKPKAAALGLTLADIGFQVKDGFYGAEAQRILRDREEVTVMVRYPPKSAASIVDLEAMHIRLPDGRFMPLKELAIVDVVWAESNIIRINGQQSAYVTASIDHSVSDSNKISTLISNEILPKVLRNHPGVKYRPDGTSFEEKETEHQLKYYSVIVLLLIYILLAIPLKSYTQPLIIMSAIPFGLVGAAWGHWLLDYPLSAMSLFGLIALCGIIVNDTLVLIDFINTSVDEEGLDYKTASIRGSGLRFRAILLTTATTFVGDLPMILETSFEARNMIPMAISLGVGIMFAIGIILILAPCLYVVLSDIQNVFGKKKAAMPTSVDN